jgi:DNA-binding transcriptional ArsR family regulator
MSARGGRGPKDPLTDQQRAWAQSLTAGQLDELGLTKTHPKGVLRSTPSRSHPRVVSTRPDGVLRGPGWLLAHVRSLADLQAHPPARPPWCIEGVVRQAMNGWIGGAPKHGKSYLTADLLLAIAMHRETWLGHYPVHQPCPVLLIEEEDPEWLLYERVRDLLGGGAQWPETFKHVVRQRVRLDDAAMMREVEGIVRHHQIGLVCWNVFNRLHRRHGAQGQELADLLYNSVDILRDTTGCANLILHHTRKRSASGVDLAEIGERLKGDIGLWSWAEQAIFIERLPRKPTHAVIEIMNKSDDVRERVGIHLDKSEAGIARLVWDGPVAASLSTGDQNRQKLVTLLEAGPQTVEALVKATRLTSRTISAHLRTLKADGIVTKYRLPGQGGPDCWTLALADEEEER